MKREMWSLEKKRKLRNEKKYRRKPKIREKYVKIYRKEKGKEEGRRRAGGHQMLKGDKS